MLYNTTVERRRTTSHQSDIIEVWTWLSFTKIVFLWEEWVLCTHFFFNNIGIIATQQSCNGGRIIKDLLINDQIKVAKVFVIDSNGQQLGELSIQKAIDVAKEQNLDLVMVSPNANPPVCKVMDYGKYKFDLQKKAKESKKNQKVVELKIMELSMKIKEHDMLYRAKQVEKFAEKGFKTKVFIKRSRGRAQIYDNKGIGILENFAQMVENSCVIEKKPEFSIGDVMMILAPKEIKK